MKTFALIKREYLQNVKTKGFLIGTVLMPVLLVLLVFMPMFFSKMEVEKQVEISVIDYTDSVYEVFAPALMETKMIQDNQSMYALKKLNVPVEQLSAQKAELDKKILSGDLDVYIVIPDSVFTSNSVEFYSKNITNFDFISRVERSLSSVISDLRLNQSGLDPELVETLTHRVNAQTFKVDKTGSEESSGFDTFMVSYVMVFILYIALLMYGQYIMRGIIEDKNSRVMEVVISSVKPWQLLTGKVIGLGAGGLTQFLIWSVSFGLISTYGLMMVQIFNPSVSAIAIPALPWPVYIAFVLYFMLGYFLYATLFAALGSMVNTESEAQNLQWPIMMLIIVAFMAMFTIIKSPDSTLAIILSHIPFFSPLLMFLRITLNAAPLFEVLLNVVVCLATIAGLLLISGKIFRVGILMYGKRPTLPELMKWIKY